MNERNDSQAGIPSWLQFEPGPAGHTEPAQPQVPQNRPEQTEQQPSRHRTDDANDQGGSTVVPSGQPTPENWQQPYAEPQTEPRQPQNPGQPGQPGYGQVGYGQPSQSQPSQPSPGGHYAPRPEPDQEDRPGRRRRADDEPYGAPGNQQGAPGPAPAQPQQSMDQEPTVAPWPPEQPAAPQQGPGPVHPGPAYRQGPANASGQRSQQQGINQGGANQVELTPPVALDQRNLVNPVKAPPKSGWRKLVHSASGGFINPGNSKAERNEEELLAAVRTPLRGDYRIAVMSLKGGVGKTTTTVALGGVFASERGDRVIAIDANPDLGTLAQRTAGPGPATIRDLLAAEDTTRYPQVKAFTTQAASRLEVIGSERDPAVSEAFSEEDYRRAIDILQHHYNVILTDCGTGLMHSAMAGVLDLANTLVLVTSSALDGAQSASATLDWLVLHGYEQLAANSVVVVSSSVPGKPTVDVDQIVEHFRSRTRAVHVIPYDRHLAEGSVVDLDRVSRSTLEAYRELAASIAEDFESWHRHAR